MLKENFVNGNKKNLKVSVLILAFNHEAYIRETLEGVIYQETNFPFDVYIHDDASTDRTQDVIREYQGKYPNLVKTIFQKENQFSQGIQPLTKFIYPKLISDYVAFCEGDDYWKDPLKLQKQVDFMDIHPEYSVCSHDVQMKFEDGVPIKERFYNKPSEGSFSFTFLDAFLNHFVATPTILVRRALVQRMPVTNNLVSGDIYAVLYFLSNGNGYFMEERMVVKRRNPKGITMNPAYRNQGNIAHGMYTLWKDVLLFAPKPYRILIRFKIAEYQRLLLKIRQFSSKRAALKLVFGAILNNPFWLFGLSKRYRSFLLFLLGR